MGDTAPTLTDACQVVAAACGADTAAALRFFGEGREFRVFIAGGVAFRFAKGATPLAYEAALLPVLAQVLPARIPVPRPPLVPEFMAYELIAGTPGDRVDPSAHPELAPALGEFLRALHAFPFDVAVALGAPTRDRWRPAPYRERVLADAPLSWPARLPAALAGACAEFAAAAPPPDASGPGCLVHGDLEAEHIIVDEEAGTLAGVIDWDDAAISCPERDLAGLWAWGGNGFLARVLAAYAAPIDVERLRFLGRCFALSDWFEADPDDDGFARRQLEHVFLEDLEKR